MNGVALPAHARTSSPASPEPAAVSVEDLRVRRGGSEILHGLSFSVARGRIAGLLGPSGCGKTTLMRALVGVQRGVTGQVSVLGDRPGSPELRRRVGYLTQERSVYFDLSVRENLEYFAALTDAGAGSVEEAIDSVALTRIAGRPVRSLSGGQQLRVSLAAALLGDPELLVLDEPTVGLDPLLRRDLWALFTRLAAAGRTLLVSSHVMDEARHCSTLLLMRQGELIWSDSPSAFTAAAGTDDLDAAFMRMIDQEARA